MTILISYVEIEFQPYPAKAFGTLGTKYENNVRTYSESSGKQNCTPWLVQYVQKHLRSSALTVCFVSIAFVLMLVSRDIIRALAVSRSVINMVLIIGS
jgi:hypothetical protein